LETAKGAVMSKLPRLNDSLAYTYLLYLYMYLFLRILFVVKLMIKADVACGHTQDYISAKKS